MNKKQLINEIIDLYDNIDQLKAEIAIYKNPESVGQSIITKSTVFGDLERAGKSLLFDSMFNNWELNSYSVEVKEDDGRMNFLTYDQWIKTVRLSGAVLSKYRYVFQDLSENEVKTYFHDQFESYFTKRVNEKKMEIVRSRKEE